MKKIFVLFICLTLCGCSTVISDNNGSSVSDNVAVSGYDLSIKDSDKNPSYLEGEVIELSDDDIDITKGGTYILRGSGSGSVTVDADNDNVFIVLDNVNIETEDFAAIYVKEADKATIILEGGNYISDGSKYIQRDDNDVDGVIFSKWKNNNILILPYANLVKGFRAKKEPTPNCLFILQKKIN